MGNLGLIFLYKGFIFKLIIFHSNYKNLINIYNIK